MAVFAGQGKWEQNIDTAYVELLSFSIWSTILGRKWVVSNRGPFSAFVF